MASLAGGAGGRTLSEIYQDARRRLARAREGAARLEQLVAGGGGGGDSGELSAAVNDDVAQIRAECAEMDRLWRGISVRGQRDLWRRKVEQLVEEVDFLKASLDRYCLRQQNQMREARERDELLQRANGESSHVLRIFDEETQARESARNSAMMLDQAYETGVAILSKYADQRDRLKRAQRKALDILNTLGLSNSVLKLAERRHRVDKWIAYGGMLITVVVMVAFWKLTH